MTTTYVVTANVGNELIGVPASAAAEIVRGVRCTPLPATAPEVLGAFPLRGKAITALDLCQLMQLPPAQAGTVSSFVVVQCDGGYVGLGVDRVHDVIAYEPDAEHASIDVLPEQVRKFVSGIARQGSQLIMVLNVDTLLHRAV